MKPNSAALIAFATFAIVLAGAAPARGQAASITSVSPVSATYGERVTITGIGFGGKNVQIRVGGVPAPVESATGSRATFRVPTGVPVGRTTVTVTNPGSRSTGSIGMELTGAVFLTLDDGHAVAGVIGSDGGVITAQSNGRTYRLTIPAGALAAPETITITPIVSMLGLPLERLIGSVHFAPEGLQFLRPATLTITVPLGADTKGLIGFSAAGAGENLHLTPFTVSADHEISLAVPHFTVAGAAGGSTAANATVACTQPTIECRYVNMLAVAQAQAVVSVCGTGCTADDFIDHRDAIYDAIGAAFIPLLGQWFAEVLQYLKTTGVADDAGLISAGHEYLAWKAYLQASPCNSTQECGDIDSLKANLQTGETALGAAYLAAIQRAYAACNDRRVFSLLTQVDQNGIYGKGGLPANLDGGRSKFACQLDIAPTFPTVVHMNDTVPLTATIAVRSVGGGGASPLQATAASLFISEGCGNFVGGGTSKQSTTDASGQIAADVRITNSCTNTVAATEVTIGVDDVKDVSGELIAFGRAVKVRASIPIVIVVTPQNATVATGDTVSFTAEVNGTVHAMKWTATGGSITAGPSSSATYTAGSTPGTYSVTAAMADDPSQSQTVIVVVDSAAGIAVRGLSAGISSFAAGTCTVVFNAFHSPLSTCPVGTASAPPDFTEFHTSKRTFAIAQESSAAHPELSTDSTAILDVSVQDDDGTTSILSSGSTITEIHDYDGAPASNATATSAFSLKIEVKGAPAAYRLQSSFFCDSFARDVDIGHCKISFSFANDNVTIGPSLTESDSATKRLSTTGTLQPGTYTLSVSAESESVHGRSVGFHASWGFRLAIEQ